MKKLTEWIRHHNIAAFFIITFAITWGLGFTFNAVMNQGQFFLAPLFFIALCGPALAGIIISATCNIAPKVGTRKARWIAFFIAWIISSLIFLLHSKFINHVSINVPMAVLTPIFVLPVPFVISSAYSRLPSVKRYLVPLIRLRGVWRWALLALVLMPGLILLSIIMSSITGRQPITAHPLPATGLPLIALIIVKFLYQLFFFNATGEEVGWRGFALPRLQEKTSPLIASLILAFFWAPWHFFLWQAEGAPVTTWRYWLDTYVNLIPATFLLVWFYNHSQGSILVAGIAHAISNTTFFFITNLDMQLLNLVFYITVLGIIVMDRMWRKLPTNHLAVCPPLQSSQTAGEPMLAKP